MVYCTTWGYHSSLYRIVIYIIYFAIMNDWNPGKGKLMSDGMGKVMEYWRRIRGVLLQKMRVETKSVGFYPNVSMYHHILCIPQQVFLCTENRKVMQDNTAHDPLARAKLLAVDNGNSFLFEKDHVRMRQWKCESIRTEENSMFCCESSRHILQNWIQRLPLLLKSHHVYGCPYLQWFPSRLVTQIACPVPVFYVV